MATGAELPGWGRWAVYRLPAGAAREDARRELSRHAELPALAAGDLRADEEGLYTLEARGPLRVSLDGIPVLGLEGRPSTGSAVARLAPGPHRLEVVPLAPQSRLLVVFPDGFAREVFGVPWGG